jgi:multidrug resistance protein, MATE family
LFRVFYALNNAIGEPRATMVINLAGLAAKVPLNLVFIHGLGPVPALGGAGCGVASTLIACGSALLAWWLIARDARYRRYQLAGDATRRWRPEWRRIATLLRLGVPIALSYAIEVVSFTAVSIALARFGTAVGAAQQIASNLVGVAYMFPLALGIATSTLTGHALGAGDPGRARRVIGTGMSIVLLTATAMAALIGLARVPLARLYSADAQVIAIAANLLGWVAPYHVFDAAQCALSATLRAYKIATLPMLIYAASLGVLGFGGGCWLAFVVKPPGWSPEQLFWAAGGAGLIVAALALAWLQHAVFRQARAAQ